MAKKKSHQVPQAIIDVINDYGFDFDAFDKIEVLATREAFEWFGIFYRYEGREEAMDFYLDHELKWKIQNDGIEISLDEFKNGKLSSFIL